MKIGVSCNSKKSSYNTPVYNNLRMQLLNGKELTEMQIGKVGAHMVCADLLKMGLEAFLAEEGLPYDIVMDVKGKLLKVQVKTAIQPFQPKENGRVTTEKYIFMCGRRGRKGKKYYVDEYDLLALVGIRDSFVGYMPLKNAPKGINVRLKKHAEKYIHTKPGIYFEDLTFESAINKLNNDK